MLANSSGRLWPNPLKGDSLDYAGFHHSLHAGQTQLTGKKIAAQWQLFFWSGKNED